MAVLLSFTPLTRPLYFFFFPRVEGRNTSRVTDDKYFSFTVDDIQVMRNCIVFLFPRINP